ncbi:MAG: PepSY domain-containing protein [Methyloceanibacter sp.]|uniref:PepSY domain-containing protein n=1 Tax=Methyloceanibacter sp. TaxID=1965321 RepID=UPI003D6CC1AF
MRMAIGALAAVLLTAGAAPAEAGCLPWKSAGALISQNSLIPGNVIYKMVQSKTGGKVISATLCESGGNFVYKIVVLGKKGEVTNLNVDARTGQF